MAGKTLGLKAERSRQALIDVAIVRYARDGLRGSSIAAIARDAGVSRTLAYAYFADGADLFRSALNQDAAGLIDEVLTPLITEQFDDLSWREGAIRDLVEGLDRYPLARRVMGGLEPDATAELLAIPALEALRRQIGDRIAEGKEAGLVHVDVDAALMGRGIVTIWITVLMAAVQFGLNGLEKELLSVRAIVESAVLRR
ncbi:MAG: TetR/AcrR family transcriptional regulator [Ilumatobacter sp.]